MRSFIAQYSCLLLLAACAGSGNSSKDDGIVITASDQDNDTIIDLHEGYVDPLAPDEENTEEDTVVYVQPRFGLAGPSILEVAKRYNKKPPIVFPNININVPSHLPKIKPIIKVGNNIGVNNKFKKIIMIKKIIVRKKILLSLYVRITSLFSLIKS